MATTSDECLAVGADRRDALAVAARDPSPVQHPAETRSVGRAERVALWLYGLWTAFVVLVALMREGLSANNVTRLLVIAFLLAGIAARRLWPPRAARHPARWFVLRCARNALVVELCYMVSRPAYASLRVTADTPWRVAVANTAIDFAVTFPAYLVIFAAFWWLLRRNAYRVGEYALVFSLAQALGDGNAAFLANPALLLFAPYVMTNYQAIQVTPFLALRDQGVWAEARPEGAWAWARRIALPLVVIPAVYWVTGAVILVVGRRLGLAPR